MNHQNRLKLALVVIIFIVLLCFTFSNYLVTYHYYQSSTITDDLHKLKVEYHDNEDLVNKIDDIQRRVYFVNSVCFEE